ncbi:MAG: IS110 family transposase [Terriglobales bacterium]
MKNNTTILHDVSTSTPGAPLGKPADAPAAPPRPGFTLGLDVDLHCVVTAIQCGHGAIQPARKWTRAQLLAWVREQVGAGHTVHTVYECCGFGYTLHEELVAAGAHSIVTTPVRLSPERRRKNDRLDARELCVRLSRHREGRPHELRPIRIPTTAERERRELGRQRGFWVRAVRRLENHGRALRLEHEHATLPGGWAGPRKWKQLAQECSPFVRAHLEPVVAQIRAAKAVIAQLTERIEATVPAAEIPTGLGALTVALVEGEVCDWHRFRGRKAVGSYTGCCPSEHSSGGVQRFGHIDRHGNAHVRVLLVEAVWRLLKWQPDWHARRKWLARLKHGASLKKKTAVALARQLAIDLWRWRTGRCTAADLGWTCERGTRNAQRATAA